MAGLETHRSRAELICRWHREGNHSVGALVRRLERFRHLTDREILEMPLPSMLAEEVVAAEAGFPSWSALEAAAGSAGPRSVPEAPLRLTGTVPILFVRDVTVAAAFWRDRLGFAVDFLHGSPPFYGAVSRDAACLHLRRVGQPNFAELAAREPSLILASIEVTNLAALFAEFAARGAAFPQRLVQQAWGGTDFHVRDPDGNTVSFVEFGMPSG